MEVASDLQLLIERLEARLREGESIRGIARKAGVSDATIRRILAGNDVSAPTLSKVAEYLHLPIEDVFRMAGLLEAEEDEMKNLRLKQLMNVFARLPEDDQEELYQMALLKLKRQQETNS